MGGRWSGLKGAKGRVEVLLTHGSVVIGVLRREGIFVKILLNK